MSHQDNTDTIIEHSEKLAKIETILDRVAENQDRMTASVQQMALSMGKIELLMEKLTNLETNTKNSIDRLHNRIDNVDTKVSGKASLGDISSVSDNIDDVNERLKYLEVFAFIGKYPKIAIFIFGVLYMMAISDVRDAVIKTIGGNTKSEVRKISN